MMNPIWGHITGVTTVILMLIFIGIWIWAWRKRHRSTFKRMSEIPMEDKPEGPLPETPTKQPDPTKDEQP
jgi:cytochrome c oxidase cbb3-type subunit IV